MGMSERVFWWRDAFPYTNQLGLGKRRWNLEATSAVVEFPLLYRSNAASEIQRWYGGEW